VPGDDVHEDLQDARLLVERVRPRQSAAQLAKRAEGDGAAELAQVEAHHLLRIATGETRDGVGVLSGDM
jgi:hypothetical protein